MGGWEGAQDPDAFKNTDLLRKGSSKQTQKSRDSRFYSFPEFRGFKKNLSNAL